MGGWRVDGYTEVRELGAGAQGRVVLARHEPSGTPVAIKYLNASASEADRERLRHEARMLGQAGSPHVARLFQLVEGPDGAAIIMEAVDGVSLKELLGRRGALGPEASLSVLKGSLLGLAAAHALGVVHRDYKPANVVVPADGRSRLVDFGIAAPAGQEAGGAGTPFYMAPEQWDRHTATPATDVYAATCVFVECVSGHRPFAGGRAELRLAHTTGPVPVGNVPEPLRALVARGMAKDPADRPPSAAAFVDELERTALAAYGPDWESRGVRALAASAVALAALFPLAAWLVPGAASAASAAGSAAGSAAAQGAAQAAGQAVGHGAAGHVAGKIAGTSAIKAFFGSAGGIATAAAGTAVVVGAGAVAVQQFTKDDPAPRPRPTITRPVAAVASVRGCPTTGIDGGKTTPPPGAAQVRLPEQVKLPKDAAVYGLGQGRYLVGPAATGCSGSVGANAGYTTVGDSKTLQISQNWQGSVGNIADQVCRYFPGSPEAAKAKRDFGPCTSGVHERQDVPTGDPALRLALATDQPQELPPPSPYMMVTLVTMGSNGLPSPVTCLAPAARADMCDAALTYWFVQATSGTKIAKPDLDRVAARITAYVRAAAR
ncbi:serine/threonine-protein kinase [Actinomadura violacea]|uniref:non-specific serine/threonine protein kinase n=1 Tax=Actinomadura violacea TaxID=2819934 RepID=A0ABS3RWS7_9ACTN|nr:serine/threonine-protein kinase [Actinomadura violacea]MBO2460465.1 serine/threonine protein kinase [Actinomadura violacea]